MAFVEIDLTGMRLESVEWDGMALRANFGRGFGARALPNGTAGLHRWSLHSGGVWPDFTDHGLTIDSVSRFEYYWEFFKTHTTGTTDVFIIEWRDQIYHASFVDTKISVDKFKNMLLYEGGVAIRQRRVAGVTYNDDGSIDEPLPTIPEDFAGEAGAGSDSIEWSWTESEDV